MADSLHETSYRVELVLGSVARIAQATVASSSSNTVHVTSVAGRGAEVRGSGTVTTVEAGRGATRGVATRTTACAGARALIRDREARRAVQALCVRKAKNLAYKKTAEMNSRQPKKEEELQRCCRCCSSICHWHKEHNFDDPVS